MSNCNCNKLSGTEKATATGVSVVVNDPQTAIKLAMEDELNNYAKKDADNITEPNKWKEKLNYLTEEDIADKADTTAVTELSEKVDTKAGKSDLESAKRDLTAEIAQKASSEDLNSAKEDLQGKIDTKADNSELQNAKSEIALSKEKLELVDKLLKVDDDTLDELKEIVAYIKQNRSDLESLSTSNIAGLDTALSEKLATSTFASFQSTNTEELDKKANANADNISTHKEEWQNALGVNDKVDKDGDKVLSTNDFTNEHKKQLDEFYAIQTEGTSIKFDHDRNYGTTKIPIETFTIDMEGAKIGTTVLINFNGSSLPRDPKIDWRGSRDFFTAGANHIIYMTLLDNDKIHANLV
ncbi:Atg14 domain-containing protein [Ornithobacterium rhinotracheale]|uniref:Atg14 domain-containing protein n=1 Tax=Ornithobacterium rhinotracheale TaxID=28251 RepID=UPI001FF404F9|nr:Atg14 domain-containing protein [Ornithobacterium rhinotracheale]MCK0201361.1 Atg14 domain-containing protein [Ornithobacterium rhinotracheale]